MVNVIVKVVNAIQNMMWEQMLEIQQGVNVNLVLPREYQVFVENVKEVWVLVIITATHLLNKKTATIAQETSAIVKTIYVNQNQDWVLMLDGLLGGGV